MSGPLSVSQMLEARAQAKLLVFNAKFIDAGQKFDVAANDYLRDWIHVPDQSIDPSVWTVRYPIPLTTAELREFKGRRRFAQGTTRYADVTKSTYQHGEKEYYKLIAAADWTGFKTSAQRLAFICKTWVAKSGAALLNTGETFTSWNGSNFFAASVSSNPYKRGAPTYKNYWTSTALTTTNVELLIADMVDRRGFNDENLGLEGDTIFCSPALYPTARSIAEDDRLANGQTNPIRKYGLKVKKLQHLTAKRWGLIHEAAMGDYPVFGAIETPEELNTWGRDSAMFEQTAYMGYDVMVDLGIALLRQEAISLAVAP